MSEKRKQIIEAAMRCFSRKGFQATSIQEIVDELGMAKGSIYFYFKSKDVLLLSVIEYYGERMMSGMVALADERFLPPREQFRVQLARHFGVLLQNREFPMMLMREPIAVQGKQAEIHGIMEALLRRYLRWLREHIDAMYGSTAYGYAGDGAALFNGMMMEYSRALLLQDEPPFGQEELSGFLVKRLDDLVEGMIRSGAKPLFDRDYAIEFGEAATLSYERELRAAIQELRRTIREQPERDVDEERRADMLSALAMFENELERPIPDRIVVRGMLAYMKELAIAPWHAAVDKLHNGVRLH